MWMKWFPWKFVISRAAKKQGFLDPITVWSYFQRFSQPSEVAGPIELMRDSAVFHSRGLINSRAIPQNSDWIWPWWVKRQFNPANNAFIPRAFSLTYINLTERNWTAVGLPDCGYLPIVDPAGLVMPHRDGWSLDFWFIDDNGSRYAPSEQDEKPFQRLCYGGSDENLTVVTKFKFDNGVITSAVYAGYNDQTPCCDISVRCKSGKSGWLVVSLRPYNPEGISFIHDIKMDKTNRRWNIDGKDTIVFGQEIERHHIRKYSQGDVANFLLSKIEEDQAVCDVGMATAAAMFKVEPDHAKRVHIQIPLDTRKLEDPLNKKLHLVHTKSEQSWPQRMAGCCRIIIPDKKKQSLYEKAIRCTALHTIGRDVYPGPFTYKRFWFRDAAFIVNALLCANMGESAKPVLDSYPHRQKHNGYFKSQDGEWDSNGQAIWTMHKYWRYTRSEFPQPWFESVCKGADWICEKIGSDRPDVMHRGLMPAGFSAEHFGPNDHYYWDDFWSVAGLRCAADIAAHFNRSDLAKKYSDKAIVLNECITQSLEKVEKKLGTAAMPVSPYRRMDSGAIGSIICGFPLQIYEAADKRLLASAEYLMQKCRVKGGFFLDISHSGVNAYLTLHLAQVLLRAGEPRHIELADALVAMASPTGQWPEAIHPRTEGGCMGDGQHIWAAAEWIVYLRNTLVYEDIVTDELILGAGIDPRTIKCGAEMSIISAPTLWGEVSVHFSFSQGSVNIRCDANWFDREPRIVVKIPGAAETVIVDAQKEISIPMAVSR